jgi:uncharacterized membrane protein YkoI
MGIMIKYLLKTISISVLIVFSITLYADDDHDKAKRLLESGDILALEVILKKAREIQPGKILEVEFETKKGKKIYEIELLNSEGIVYELKFDAKTGKHLSTEKEN